MARMVGILGEFHLWILAFGVVFRLKGAFASTGCLMSASICGRGTLFIARMVEGRHM